MIHEIDMFFKDISAPQWSATVSTVALIITIIVQIREWRKSIFSRSIETALKFEDKFDSPDFRKIRKSAATYLLSEPYVYDYEAEEKVCHILNFFETLGFLYSKKAISVATIWQFFGYWAINYYLASKPIIERSKKDDRTLYSELEILFNELVHIEQQRRSGQGINATHTPESINEFLVCEAALHE